MTATATIEGVKILGFRPVQGRRFLSINLGKIDFTEATRAATSLGFQPDLVQMPTASGIQLHLLLWEGEIANTPEELEDKFDRLAEMIDPAAIRYATGGWVSKTI